MLFLLLVGCCAGLGVAAGAAVWLCAPIAVASNGNAAEHAIVAGNRLLNTPGGGRGARVVVDAATPLRMACFALELCCTQGACCHAYMLPAAAAPALVLGVGMLWSTTCCCQSTLLRMHTTCQPLLFGDQVQGQHKMGSFVL